ncbi:MAG: hypothetical protein ACK5Q7_06845 [Cyanobacteriota bacterium]
MRARAWQVVAWLAVAVAFPAEAAERGWRLVEAAPTAPGWRLVSPDGGRGPAARTVPLAAQAEPRPSLPVEGPVPEDLAPPRRIQYAAPLIGGGVPSGYVAGWGEYYLALSAGTPGKQRDGVPDGSINFGFGLGDPYRTLGVQLDVGIGSVKNLGANGGIGGSIGRVLVNEPTLQVAVAGGVMDLWSYTTGESGYTFPNGYGAITVATPLRRNDPHFSQVLQVSAGVGGNNFTSLDENFQGPTVGAFASVGVEVTPRLGVSMGWSGRGTNAGVSVVPFASLPITVNLIGADLFNASPFGTVGVLTVAWGDSFRTGYFAGMATP